MNDIFNKNGLNNFGKPDEKQIQNDNKSWEDLLFEKAEPKDESFIKLSAGAYNATFQNAEFKTSKSGKKMVIFKYKINGGEFDGNLIFENFVIDGEMAQTNLNKLLFRGIHTFGLLEKWEKNLNSYLDYLNDHVANNVNLNIVLSYKLNPKTQDISDYYTIDEIKRV